MFENTNFCELLKQDIDQSLSIDSSVNFMRYSVNHNYQVVFNNSKYFCRVYRPEKETLETIEAEHEFLDYLHINGVPVAKPVKLNNDNCIGQIFSADKDYYYSCFEYIEGDHIGPDNWDTSFVRAWGQALGLLHVHSKKFKSKAGKQRYSWEQLKWSSTKPLTSANLGLLQEDIDALKNEWDQINDFFLKLPRNEDFFGLVHYDFHPGNLIKRDSELVIIDFDDACEFWFAWDFAMPFHRLGKGHMSNKNSDLKDLFVKAYKEKNYLPDEIEIHLKTFERIRHFFMLSWLSLRKDEDKWRNIFPRYLNHHINYIKEHPKL